MLYGSDTVIYTSATPIPMEELYRNVPAGAQTPEGAYWRSPYIDWDDTAWCNWLNGATDISPTTGNIDVSYSPIMVPWKRQLGMSRGAATSLKVGYDLEVTVTCPAVTDPDPFFTAMNTISHDSGTNAAGNYPYQVARHVVPAAIFDGGTQQINAGTWKISLMFAGYWYCDLKSIEQDVDGVLVYEYLMTPHMVEVRNEDLFSSSLQPDPDP